MRLWLLRRTDGEPKCNLVKAMVVRAQDETEARRFAFACDKHCNQWTDWTDPDCASCEPLDHEGKPAGVVIADYHYHEGLEP